MHSISANPDFMTIVKIADYFSCSIDQIIGRRGFKPEINRTVHFNNLDLHYIHNNLYTFLKEKVVQYNISTYFLSKNIGFSKTTIHCFLKANSPNKMLSTDAIIAIADYFNVSVDYIIGRYPTKNQ